MKRATLVVLLLLAAGTVIAAGRVWGQSGSPAIELRRSVPRDTESRVAWHGNWRSLPAGNCATGFIPTLELVTPPTHGTVRFGNDVNVVPRSGCNNPIYGSAVLYRPNPGFVGQDQFTYKLPGNPMAMTCVGPPPGNRTVIVTVH